MPKMIDIYTNIQLLRQKPRITFHCFPKKLLIAAPILVIIAMCLTPVEGRVMDHRMRHQRHASNQLELTKEPTVTARRLKHPDPYANVTEKIIRKLTNVRRSFVCDQKNQHESREYDDGNPRWLPKVNFVRIHDHRYSSRNTQGATIKELRFKYLIPKLYKSLKEYERILSILINVTTVFEEDLEKDYKNAKWLESVTDAHGNLTAFVTEIADKAGSVKLVLPRFDESRMYIGNLEEKIDTSRTLKNNYLAFRGYGKLLAHWIAEFKCPKYKHVKGGFILRSIRGTRFCRDYMKWLEKRKKNVIREK